MLFFGLLRGHTKSQLLIKFSLIILTFFKVILKAAQPKSELSSNTSGFALFKREFDHS